MSLTFASIKSEEIAAVHDDLIAVYRAAFAEPPYNKPETAVQTFATQTFPRHVARDGFRCYVARQNDQIVGLAYGYTGAPGQWWHDLVRRAMDEPIARYWLDDCFELVELAVLPSVQGRGIGTQLHDRLLADLPQRTALLSTLQADTAGLRLYRKRGWQTVLTDFVFPGGSQPYLILGYELDRQRRI